MLVKLIVDEEPVPSPCISICRMDPDRGTAAERAAGGLCVGCLRTLDEIMEWASAFNPRNLVILAAVDARKR